MVSRFATWIPFCPVERLNDLMIFVILMDWSPGYLNFRGLYWEREREGEGGRERERGPDSNGLLVLIWCLTWFTGRTWSVTGTQYHEKDQVFIFQNQ